MKSIVVGLALKWIVAEMASSSGAVDWVALKAKVGAAVTAAIHSAFFDQALIGVADSVLDAVAKMAQDQAAVLAVLTALAGQNLPAAEAALKALVGPYLPAELVAAL